MPMYIFERHLGPAYAQLNPMVQQAHIGRISLNGNVFVRQGNFFARLLCRMLNMPSAGEQVPLRVMGIHAEHNMDWQRSFAGHAMHSQFKLEGDNLVEKLGPLKLCMQLRVEETGKLNYCLQESRLWGMRVPARLSPSLLAYEDELNGRYHFHVRIALPAIGKLIEYGGVLELTPDADN